MATILVDYNMEGQAIMLWDTFTTSGWQDLIQIQMIMFAWEAGSR